MHKMNKSCSLVGQPQNWEAKQHLRNGSAEAWLTKTAALTAVSGFIASSLPFSMGLSQTMPSFVSGFCRETPA